MQTRTADRHPPGPGPTNSQGRVMAVSLAISRSEVSESNVGDAA
jgi:hypothetical protein